MLEARPTLLAISVVALLLGVGIGYAAPFETAAEPGVAEQGQPVDPAEAPGRLTVSERERTEEGVSPSPGPFYASRIVTVSGNASLASLPVSLTSVEGPIEVEAVEGEELVLLANLTGYGSTPEQARGQRDEMRFDWDAGEPGDRELVAEIGREEVRTEDELDRRTQEAQLRLYVPEDVELELSAQTADAPVRLAGLQADRLVASTSNAGIEASAEGTSTVRLVTTNAAVEAELSPGSEGSIHAATTNAPVDVLVPETEEHGYDVDASTTAGGQARIGLQEGEVQRSDDGTEASFRTYEPDQRPIATEVTVETTDADATVAPP